MDSSTFRKPWTHLKRPQWVALAAGASARMDGGPMPSLVTAADLTQTSTRASLAPDRAPREKSPVAR